jgi:single-stranded-DNA-specific exonuclease
MGQPLGRALLDNRGCVLHAAGHIAVDRWQGEERVQLRLADVAAGDCKSTRVGFGPIESLMP